MLHHYSIAGLIVEMDSFGRIVEQAKPYLTHRHAHADIIINSIWQDVRHLHTNLDDSTGEYIATGISFHHQLLEHEGLMLHSSAVVVDGRAYLFSADSGTGKSTHTQLWLKKFGEKAFILNDDKPALRLIDGVWYACGTPWSGKHDLSTNACVPLAGIAYVERGECNEIARFKGPEAIYSIFKQCSKPENVDRRAKLLELLDKLLRAVPVWKLKCNMDIEAAEVAYRAMSGKDE